jgi:hypothetical protein
MLQNLWRNSIAFRRVVAVLSLAAAVLVTYVASNIPQSATLPNEDIDKLAAAHPAEHLRIYNPRVNEGDSVLSFEGAENVNAELWVHSATLTGSSLRFAQLAPAGPVLAVYSQADEKGNKSAQGCRTTFTVRRADGSSAPQALDLWQEDTDTAFPKFRQVVLSSPQSSLVVEASTDAAGDKRCPRALIMGSTRIVVENGPVDLVVPANQPIKLRFSSMDSTLLPWLAKDATFDALSLGDGTLVADGFDVLVPNKPPRLHIAARKDSGGITLENLRLGAQEVRLSAGRENEKADAWKDGKRLTVFDLVDKVQKNPVLGYLFAAVVIPALYVWIKKTCFPAKRKVRRRVAHKV